VVRTLALCALVGAGCSGPTLSSGDAHVADAAPDAPPPDDGARSGARLKLSWFNFADGTRTWGGFYDAERKEPCFLYDWGDGKTYCVGDDLTSDVVFTNSICTAKVVEVYNDPGCAQPPPKYAIEYPIATCDYRPTHIYARGAAAGVSQYWYRDNNGGCQGPFTTSANYSYYQLGPEMLVSDFVQVTTSSPADTGRLGQRFYQSADGMRRPGPVHDAMLGTDCYPSTYGNDTTGTCNPSASYAYYLGDTACTQPKLDLPSSCAKPQYTAFDDQNSCPADPPRFYTTGNAVGGSPLYYRSQAQCVATTPATSTTYYSIGQLISSAPVGHSVEAIEARRLQLMRYTTPEGLATRDYSLYDTTKGVSCYPTTLPDGTYRCMPSGGYISTFYTNSACTQQASFAVVQSGPSSCGLPSPPKFASRYVAPAPGSCQYSREIHPIAGIYTGPVYQNYGTCTLYTPYNEKLYMIGATTPVTDFMAATLTTDP
jgi:hypothetical protein